MPPIYEKSTRLLLADAATDLTPPFTASDIVSWFAENYSKPTASNVGARTRFLTAVDE